MLRRTIYFLLVTILLGGLGGMIAFYAFEWKPKFLAQVIMSAPKPVETVSAEAARMEEWQPTIGAIGTLTAVKGIDVTAEVGGIVQEIFFESGQEVKKGDRLVQLDISTEQADLKNLEVQLGNAQTEFDRVTKTASKGYTSRADLDTARTRRDMFAASADRVKALIAQKAIYAPWDGRLGLRNIAVGKYIAAGQQLVWLQSLDPIYADFTVTEVEFGRLAVGQPVSAVFATYPGEVFRGKLMTTDAKMSDTSRMITVRATLDNPDGKLLPGMYAKVQVEVGEPQQVVTVPQTAITYSLYGNTVFVAVPVKADQKATEAKPADGNADKGDQPATARQTATAPLEIERRFVKVGSVRDNRVQIVDGLKPGDQVVIAGQNKIDQGTHVRIDNSVALNAPADRLSQ